MKKRPERRWTGPCFASQVARRAASSNSASSSVSLAGTLAEESEAIVITKPMVRDVELISVYLREEPQATIEPAPHVFLGDVVSTGVNPHSNPRHSEITLALPKRFHHQPRQGRSY
jgi:hypothetical protein